MERGRLDRVRPRPISPDLLVTELAERISGWSGDGWVRVAVDGAAPARPEVLADRLVDPLRAAGRPVLRVGAGDFLRPASVRLETGRTDPDSFYDGWLDTGGLVREVLAPLDQDTGTGRVLPSLWDAERDRASRAGYVTLPRGGVLLVDGTLLLGRGLPFELTVHLWLSDGALDRLLDASLRWTLPAYARYTAEVGPERTADVVVRVDNPERPAVMRDAPAEARDVRR